ncbi:MAG: LuxR C-terminal-related transcriptional regulator, partial [Mycobacterium sp.]
METRPHPGNGSYSVLVVDDHELFSISLVIALRWHGLRAEQVRTVSVEAILAGAKDLPTGVAVLDLNLGQDADGQRLNGCDLVGTLRCQGWTVIVVSASSDERRIAAAIAAGAIGSVPKSASFDTLLSAILSAVTGKTLLSESEQRIWLDLHRRHLAEEHELALQLERLTKRERAVLEMLAEGHRAATIADKFVVSLTTVRSQIQSILSKLAVNSQLEAVAL